MSKSLSSNLRGNVVGLALAIVLFIVARELPPGVRGSSLYQAVFVDRWPWWAGGAGVAAVVLGLLFTDNRQLGVSGACGELCVMHHDPAARQSWRPPFLLGIVLGGALSAWLAQRTPTFAMGGFDAIFGDSTPLKLAVLLGAGALVGAGARLAGGCTSGHGIVGTALGARSSWVATGLFMVTGFAVTKIVHLLAG